MKSAVENVEPTRVKLTVEVPLEELKGSLDHAYSHIAEQVSIPGFRKGKVPPRIIDQRVGRAAVLEHAINDAVPGLYRKALSETDLRPLGQPEIEVTSVPGLSDDAAELVFTAEVDVRPAITLPELDDFTVTVEDLDVTEDDVAERLTTLRERYASLVGVDRAAVDGDFVTLDLRASIGEDEVDSVSGVSYQIGSGNMLEGLDEALTGLSANETATFTAPLAGGEHAGEDAEVTVTPTAVKEQDLPEVDDDFAQIASEFDTIDELREDLRTQVADAKSNNRAVQARDQLLEHLLSTTDFPLPNGVIEAEIHRHLENEGRLEDDTHREEVRVEATDTLRRQLLLDTLAEQVEVKVGQNELVEFLVRTAQQYGMEPNEFITSADKNGQIPMFVAELSRNKALAVALRKVNVVDSTGSSVDLSDYVGSDDEDAVERAMAQASTVETIDVETVDVDVETVADEVEAVEVASTDAGDAVEGEPADAGDAEDDAAAADDRA